VVERWGECRGRSGDLAREPAVGSEWADRLSSVCWRDKHRDKSRNGAFGGSWSLAERGDCGFPCQLRTSAVWGHWW
jgi:hypothetical protein